MNCSDCLYKQASSQVFAGITSFSLHRQLSQNRLEYRSKPTIDENQYRYRSGAERMNIPKRSTFSSHLFTLSFGLFVDRWMPYAMYVFISERQDKFVHVPWLMRMKINVSSRLLYCTFILTDRDLRKHSLLTGSTKSITSANVLMDIHLRFV